MWRLAFGNPSLTGDSVHAREGRGEALHSYSGQQGPNGMKTLAWIFNRR